MIVRSATSRDLDRLRTAVGLSFPRPPGGSPSADSTLLVVTEGGEGGDAVGCAEVRIGCHGSPSSGSEDGSADSIVRAFRSGQLVRLAVDPGRRRRGAGRALVGAAVEWVRERGVEDLQLVIQEDDDGPRRFADALHFTPLQRELNRAVATIEAGADPECREVTPSDVSAVAELVRDEVTLQCEYANWFRLHDPIDWEAFVEGKVRSGHTGLLTIGSRSSLVGYVEVTSPRVDRGAGGRARRFVRSVLRGSPPCPPGRIEDIFVREGARGTGAAEALVEGARRWLASRGVEDVCASVWAKNERSLRFFTRLGFVSGSLRLRRGVRL